MDNLERERHTHTHKERSIVVTYFDQKQKVDILASWRLSAYLTIILVVNVDALDREKRLSTN